MPIHHTKLTTPNAHATGMLLPQVPMPAESVYESAITNSPTSPTHGRNSIHQPRPCVVHTGSKSESVSVRSS